MKQKWINSITSNKNELAIISKRLDEVPGTHSITYKSTEDEISISHVAYSRKGFALGAVVAAEWIKDKKSGMYGMEQLMEFSIEN